MNNLSFTSRINFVDEQTFSKVAKGAFFDCYPWQDSFKKAPEFHTYEIRSCTAGGIVDTKTKEVVGFHYYDCETYFEGIEKFIDNLFDLIKNPDRCLVIGGKDMPNSPFSVKSFNKFKEILSDRIANVSIFGYHLPKFDESSIHYSINNDEWNIFTGCKDMSGQFYRFVTSPKSLNENFKTIKIADGDTLLINGKLITPEQL